MSHDALKPINELIAQAFGQPKPAITGGMPPLHDLESVDRIRQRVLTPEQLDALAFVQDGLVALNQMAERINGLLVSSGIDAKPLNRIEPGRLWHDIEGLLFEHNSAAARLRNADQPVHVDTITRRAA
ncbi:hypothetical protein OL229_05235 [Neisseriaceae bacterium JH1-16]|nr:hypothetical protein [Neisseriaceae bacterium JH1-16]